jgi:hypothetical protein
MSQSNGDAL